MSFISGLKALMGIAPKAVNDVLDKDNGLVSQAGAWIGNQNFTAEEAAELNASLTKGVIEYAKHSMDENSERSKARRELAVMYMRFYLGWSSVGFAAMSFDLPFGDKVIAALTGLALGGAFSAIIVFFFGSHGLARIKAANNK